MTEMAARVDLVQRCRGVLRKRKARADLRFWRDGEATRYDVLAVEGELDVEQRGTGSASEA